MFEFLVARALVGSKAPFSLYSAQNIEKRYPPPFRWFERAALRRASAVRVCNRDAARIMRAKGFTGRIELVGLGVDTAALSRPRRARSGDLRVGYVGRLEDHKGVHVLIDAIARVPDAALTIVGDGPARARLEDRTQALGLSERVTFTGFVDPDELPDRYATFDVVVVPSLPTPRWAEQFGRVAVEAMAAGVPVIASDMGELPSIVRDAGVLVPPDDAAALSVALDRLASDGELRSRLAAAGRVRAERYSWPAIAAQHHALYQAMTERVPVP